jgi:hypothetical protein
LYLKLSSQIGHQSTSISSSLSSIIADSRSFQHNSEVLGAVETEERSFLSLLKSKDALMGIFGGIFIVVFIFILVLLISFLIIKLKRTKKQPKIPESTSTINRDIDEIHEVDDEDEDDNNIKKTGFFKRKAKTYSSTSSKKKLVLNNANNNVKLKLLNNELNMNSVHNTFQREIKLKNYVDQSTTTTKTLEKNLIKEASKKMLNLHQESEKSTSMESLNKSDSTNNKDLSSPTKISPNIISPDYNYIQLYNSNKKIKIKNINKEDAVVTECENLIKNPDQMVVIINEQNNLDKDDSEIIEDCQGNKYFY